MPKIVEQKEKNENIPSAASNRTKPVGKKRKTSKLSLKRRKTTASSSRRSVKLRPRIKEMTCSGCSQDDIKFIRLAARTLGGSRVTPGFSFEANAPIVTTTHVVCHWVEGSNRCRRTIKTMMALASGIWIVDCR